MIENIECEVIGIIQARMGSKRFPKKMLSKIGRYTLIEWVLRRVIKSKKLDKIILATSNLPENKELIKIAETIGVNVVSGSENDVLNRFYNVSKLYPSKNIVRICADNPFVDPFEIDRLISFFKKNKCDYACNHQDRLGSGYADGFGAEIFSKKVLIEICKIAKSPSHLEHVTLYLWDNIHKYKLKAVPAPIHLNNPNLKYDIDIEEDLLHINTELKRKQLNKKKPENITINDILLN